MRSGARAKKDTCPWLSGCDWCLARAWVTKSAGASWPPATAASGTCASGCGACPQLSTTRSFATRFRLRVKSDTSNLCNGCGTSRLIQDAELAFDTACDLGHLTMAKWLLKAHPTLDVYAQGERPFWTTCAKGYLEFAQWLWAQRGHARWQNALLDASQHSHVHVVQWLLRVATEEGGFHTHLNRTYVCIAVAYAPNMDVARAILRVCPISESVFVWNTLKRRRDVAMGRWLLAQGWNPQGDVQWLQMWSPARAVWIQSVVSLHAPSQKSSSDK